MKLFTEAFAQTLPLVAAPFDWTGIIAAAIVVALVVYIIYIKRKPGLQFGEGAIGMLIATLHNNTVATQAATVATQTATPTAPVITQADLQAAIAAALAARAQPQPAPLPMPAAAPFIPTITPTPAPAAAPLPTQINPSVPTLIEFPKGSGTMVWLYQNINFATQEEIVAWDIASAARDANLANIDHSPLPLTDQQVADAIAAGGDPTARASWKNPSATYQSAIRIRDGLTPDDVNRRINEANGAGNYGIFPKS